MKICRLNKGFISIYLLLFILTGMLVLQTTAVLAEEVKREVGVWYLPLWTANDEYKHWTDVRKRGGAMPIYGQRSASDPLLMKIQYRQMRECGIDFIAFDHTNCIWVDGSMIDNNIKTWFDFMDRLPVNQRIPLAIVTGGELNQHSNREAWLKAVDYLYTTYSKRPSYLKIDGKPVLHWYIEKDVWDDWIDDRWIIRRTYHFFRMDGQIKYGGWGFGADHDPPFNKECMSFHPGWDLTGPGHQREGGKFYQRMWLKALKYQPIYVFLSDWNGWCEGTALEDSIRWKDSYGDTAPSWYRLMTRGYIAAYKGKLINGFYYCDESSNRVFKWNGKSLVPVDANPHKIPVIMLPDGYVNKLIN